MERVVKGIWIPISVWEDESLSWNERILLMEIDSFTSNDKACFVSNEWIANRLGIRLASASRLVSSLVSKGLVSIVSFDGRKRYLKSNLNLPKCKADSTQSVEADSTQMLMQHSHNCEYSNTLTKPHTNNKDKDNREKSERFDFYKALVDLGVDSEVAKAWMSVRKAKKAVNTKIAFDRIKNEILKAGFDPTSAIRIAVEHSWQGFQAEWIFNLDRTRSNQPLNREQQKVENIKKLLMDNPF